MSNMFQLISATVITKHWRLLCCPLHCHTTLRGDLPLNFIVDDADNHFEMAKKNGIVAVPNEVEVRPWMSFITVVDPDNHQIVFGTKNQAYYDQARNQLNNLDRP